ncbi:MAG TPA: hypothetical protein P5519_07970, partial [Spirochaetia bacterium]|nr:hypothetical protein [Spirochaetia bacterium]
FYSLVITFYLLTLLLLKQIAGSSKLRYGIILFPILFWITVFLHDRLLFSIPAEMLAKVLVSSFIAISSIIIILIPPYSKKLPHTQDSNQ